MKKLIFSLIVLCVSCLNVCTAADGKNWPLYEDYLEKHVINGKSDRNDAETVSRIMFMALCQDQKDLFLNLKEQLVIKTEDGKKKYRYDRASEALMLAYDLLEADRIWNIPELKKDADTI